MPTQIYFSKKTLSWKLLPSISCWAFAVLLFLQGRGISQPNKNTPWPQREKREEHLQELEEKMNQKLQELDRIKQQYQEEMKSLHQEMAELKSEVGKEKKTAGALRASLENTLSETAQLSTQSRTGNWQDLGKSFGGIYAKPFLTHLGRTSVGGYADFQVRLQKGHNAVFDLDRFVPFLYADVSETVKMAAEIEFEHGGVLDKIKADNSLTGEARPEFAVIDWIPNPDQGYLNFRAGIILTPLGNLNLVHDSPLQELTDRPLVDQTVIPTTLSQPGFGFFGHIFPKNPDSEWTLKYELYLVQGLQGLEGKEAPFTLNISRETGLEDAHDLTEQGFNNSPSVVGRVAYSPFLGAELGLSNLTGKYDERGENPLSITALDWTVDGRSKLAPSFLKGPWEFVGEGAYASIHKNSFITNVVEPSLGESVPGHMAGYYAQVNYHFLPEWLHRWAPSVFKKDESTFTWVTRWDQINLDRQAGVGAQERLTFGLNFRPVHDTVFKIDWQINTHTNNRRGDDAFLFSVATYF